MRENSPGAGPNGTQAHPDEPRPRDKNRPKGGVRSWRDVSDKVNTGQDYRSNYARTLKYDQSWTVSYKNAPMPNHKATKGVNNTPPAPVRGNNINISPDITALNGGNGQGSRTIIRSHMVSNAV